MKKLETPEAALNIAKVRARIQQARAGRPASCDPVRLLAVSKGHGAERIREAFAAGQREFGENYAQEAEDKIEQLKDLPLVWHFIGPLQSNKTAFVAKHCQWVHSLDREKIARRLSEQRPAALPPLNVCLQVNIDGEASKSGIAPGELPALAREVAGLPGLCLRGLMAIPDPKGGEAGLQSSFIKMGDLFRSLQQQYPHLPIDTLSLGMSADLELAIAAGSTLVRIGTDIFGPRPSRT